MCVPGLARTSPLLPRYGSPPVHLGCCVGWRRWWLFKYLYLYVFCEGVISVAFQLMQCNIVCCHVTWHCNISPCVPCCLAPCCLHCCETCCAKLTAPFIENFRNLCWNSLLCIARNFVFRFKWIPELTIWTHLLGTR